MPRPLPAPPRPSSPPLAAVLAALALVLAPAVAGCFTPAQRREETLLRVAREYNDGLRWRRYEQVTAHMAPDEAERLMSRTGALADDFEVADQELASVRFVEPGMRADVTVDYTWYQVRRALVRRTVVKQDWQYRDGRWICAAQRRVRGDRFPLVPEPATGTATTGTPAAAAAASAASAASAAAMTGTATPAAGAPAVPAANTPAAISSSAER